MKKKFSLCLILVLALCASSTLDAKVTNKKKSRVTTQKTNRLTQQDAQSVVGTWEIEKTNVSDATMYLVFRSSGKMEMIMEMFESNSHARYNIETHMPGTYSIAGEKSMLFRVNMGKATIKVRDCVVDGERDKSKIEEFERMMQQAYRQRFSGEWQQEVEMPVQIIKLTSKELIINVGDGKGDTRYLRSNKRF